MVHEGAALLDRPVTSVTPPHFSTGVYSREHLGLLLLVLRVERGEREQ